MAAVSGAVTIAPLDEHNRRLVENVRPERWVNPAPAPRYNLVVVGAGPGGLVAAAGAAGLGAKVALVEKGLMGGDCLNVGCVPSKALIRAARAAGEVDRAAAFGLERSGAGGRVDFGAVMERVRRVRAELSATDSAERFRSLGVDVFLGAGRFTGPASFEVGGAVLRFAKAVIATGARACGLPIPGLEQAGYLTNETVFSLTELPRRLALVGAGPVGCELAQAFRRFGAEVTVLEVAPRILIREDLDAAAVVAGALSRDGVKLLTGCRIDAVERAGGAKLVSFEREGASSTLEVDEVLLGVGRAPAVDGLNLEAANVAYDRQNGIRVDNRLCTTNPRIYAAGDVCSPFKFTHAADAMARVVLRNALFGGRERASRLVIPWCVYTEPEIAQAGLTAEEAGHHAVRVDTFFQRLDGVDRAVLDGETEGFVKVHVRKRSSEIVGATIVASHASEMINELTLAMVGGIGLDRLATVIHPYPTQAEAIKKVADARNRARLTPLLKWAFSKWFQWNRRRA